MIFKRLARSELLSTFFPTWIWQGRIWSTWRIPKYDPYYWINAHAHPVVSTYYPASILSSLIGNAHPLDKAFVIILTNILFHIIFSFFGWYWICNSWSNPLIAIFGAITFTLAGYNWKQQPCFQYTVAWFPWLLLGIAKGNLWLSSLSFGMIILAGYYPIGLQIALIAVGASFAWHTSLLWILGGGLIGSVQLIPFLKYLPKTIRTKKVSNIGKVPWWHFASLIFPKAFRFNVNGVGYWEMSYYIGIIPLLTIWYTTSRACFLIALSLLLMLGLFADRLPRIPARWSYTFQFAMIWCAIDGLNTLNLPPIALYCLILLQTFDLWINNSSLLVNHPYAELYNKTSWAFNTRLTRFLAPRLNDNRVSGLPYPLFTGHINGFKTLGYCGGMQLKLMAKWRNDNNPDGAGQHDFFKGDGKKDGLGIARVKYARTVAKTDWINTGIPHLYLNPEFQTR